MTFAKVHEVLRFIDAIKGRYPYEIEDTFSNGFCYWFAKILELRFGGTIYYNPDIIHFAVLIEEQLFDITGLIEAGDNWFNWEDYQSKNDTEDIYHSCILKDQ
jgi:hypothetical protein